MDKEQIAEALQINMASEAHAIADYTKLINDIANSTLDDAVKELISADIKELISDELNHQRKLFATYTKLSGINAAAS